MNQIIDRYFTSEHEALEGYFAPKQEFKFWQAEQLERESFLHKKREDKNGSVTCRIYAAGAYVLLATRAPHHYAYDTVCAALAYDHAGKDAEDLKWPILEFFCRMRNINLLQKCTKLEGERQTAHLSILVKTGVIRQGSYVHNIGRAGDLAKLLRRGDVPQIVLDHAPNVLTRLFA